MKIIFIIIFLISFCFNTYTENIKTLSNKPVFFDNFKKTLDSYIQNNNFKELSNHLLKYPSYSKNYIHLLINEYLTLENIETEKNINLKDKITDLINLFETSTGDFYLHDLWLQYSNYTDEEIKLKLETDKLLIQNFPQNEFEILIDQCLDNYYKINDYEGIYNVKKNKIKNRIKFNDPLLLDEINNLKKEALSKGQETHELKTIKAYIYLNKGAFLDALNELDKSEKSYKKSNDIYNAAKIQLQKGEIYSKTGYYKNAHENFLKALNTFKNQGYNEIQASISISLGNLLLRQNNKDEALNYFNDANDIYSKLNNKPGKSKVLNNLGVIYNMNNKTDIAKQNFEESIKIAEEIQDLRQLAESGNNLGSLHLRTNNIDEAIKTFKNTIKATKKTNLKEVEIQALHNLGIAYYFSSKPKEAKSYLLESLSMSRRSGQDADALETSFILGKFYIQEKNNSKAKNFLNISLDIAKKLKRKNKIKEIEDLIKGLSSK